MHIIIDALGYIMGWCYSLVGNYGLAIIFFTFISKLVLLPLSVWVQFNSIKMIRMQPEINMLKVQYYGDKDRIYEEQVRDVEKDMAKAFRYGIAAGAASVMTEGTQLIVRSDFEALLDQVKVQEV